jgi:nucleotide-binding universal stress UspA family protein
MSEIIVGVDGTEGAADAVAFARRLVAATGAEIRLVTAFPYSDTRTRASNEAYRDALFADAVAVLERFGDDVSKQAIADPSPPHALHALAEETGAAFVVVGSTRRGPVGRVLPGSTAERLLHGSPAPVAIVPRGHEDAELRTIGVGYDGSEESEAALHAACELARRLDAELRVIRVHDPRAGVPSLVAPIPGYAAIDDDLEAMERGVLERRVRELDPDVHAAAVFVSGVPGAELGAQTESLDLLVLGSRGYGPLRAVLLGGVSHAAVRSARCPVVVLPHGARTGLEALFATAGSARS